MCENKNISKEEVIEMINSATEQIRCNMTNRKLMLATAIINVQYWLGRIFTYLDLLSMIGAEDEHIEYIGITEDVIADAIDFINQIYECNLYWKSK